MSTTHYCDVCKEETKEVLGEMWGGFWYLEAEGWGYDKIGFELCGTCAWKIKEFVLGLRKNNG